MYVKIRQVQAWIELLSYCHLAQTLCVCGCVCCVGLADGGNVWVSPGDAAGGSAAAAAGRQRFSVQHGGIFSRFNFSYDDGITFSLTLESYISLVHL